MTAGQNRIPVNLDYAASTPMRAEALLAQREYDDSELAGVNPNSLHSLGRKAAARLEVARREIARSFGARVRPSEIVLTNGGTEANQLALLGLAEGARQRDRKRDRVIVSAIEHDSILDNLPLLRAAGFSVDLVQPCRAGYIEPAALIDLLGDDLALVSIMVANNETGVVQPIRELAAATHTVGALFHTDAIQGYLHIPLDVTELTPCPSQPTRLAVPWHLAHSTLRAARRCARASLAADRRPVVVPARKTCERSSPLPLPPRL